MLFNSYIFIFVFLPLVFCGYFYLQYFEKRLASSARKNRDAFSNKYNGALARAFLVLASLFFYSFYNIIYLPLILASIGVNFAIGTSLGKLASMNFTYGAKIMCGGGAI